MRAIRRPLDRPGPRTAPAPLVSLVDRLRWVSVLRALVTALPLVAWAGLPADRTGPFGQLLVPALACAVTVLLGAASARLFRPVALWVLSAGLLVDGAYLGWAFRCLDGFDGAVGYVIVLHAVGLTLVASFRTGVKLALWHSLVVLVVVQADLAGVFGAPVLRVATTDYVLQIGVLWVLTLVTAVLAAVNERELRRRRYDSDVLRRFALGLESATGTTGVAVLLSRLAQEDLLATRAVVLVLNPGARGTGGVVLDGDGVPAQLTGPRGELPAGSLPARALSGRCTLLARRPHEQHDEWLAAALPGARNLVVVPLVPGGEIRGVLVVEHLGGRRRFPGLRPGGRRPRVERRAVATLEQAAAHAGQALARTALMARLTAAASTDALTGLANRRSLDTALAAALDEASATGVDCSVLLLDLDHFKTLNDTHGHPVGDRALQAVGAVLRSALREECAAARYGGEEFCVVLPRTTHEEALVVAERLRRAIAATDAAPVPVTASVGVATFPRHGGDAGALVAAADGALYAAKTGGRDRVAGPVAAQAPGGPREVVAAEA